MDLLFYDLLISFKNIVKKIKSSLKWNPQNKIKKLLIVNAGLCLVVLAHYIHIFYQVSFVKLSTFRMNKLSISNHILSMVMVIVSGKSQGSLDNPVCERKLYNVLHRLQTSYVTALEENQISFHSGASFFHVPKISPSDIILFSV